ncbi:MAG: hypothetical protein MUD11_07220 [Rhodobacteraceae bacterium]|nr:hypothetical protein [Paracoccaceae bacterium]
MTGASKILTVSYGTFSCTLEGFDDPFNTMKAIAEYFRDLAAEDRYFGAEPPTPDAAMLHRIAEREVQRRVEASVQDNGVILRAQSDAPLQAAPLPAPTPSAPEVVIAEAAAPEAVAFAEPQAQPVADVPEVAAVPEAILDEAILDDDAVEEAVTAALRPDAAADMPEDMDARPETTPPAAVPALSAMPEGVAARLAKIRAAVAMTEAAPAAMLSPYAEDQHADEAFAAFDTLAEPVVPTIADVSYHAPADDAEGDDAPAPQVAIAPVTPSDDSLSDEVVEAGEVDLRQDDDLDLSIFADESAAVDAAPVADQPDFAAYQPVGDDDAEDADDALLAALEDDLRAAMTDDVADDAARVDDAVDDAVATDDDLRDLMMVDAATVAEVDAATSDFAALDDAGDDAMLAQIGNVVAPVVVDDLPPLLADDDADDATMLADAVAADADAAPVPEMADDADDAAEAAADDAAVVPDADTIIFNTAEDMLPQADMAEGPVPEVVAAAVDTPEVADKAQRARARIIRVRRNPEIAVQPAVPAAAASVTETVVAEVAPAALSDEAEAELQRELAALEEAAAEGADQITSSAEDLDAALRAQLNALGAEPAPETAVADSARAVAGETAGQLDPTVQDEALRRLMDQTQSEMAEPANRRRLSSIAHLKAAVAATIAERFGSKPKPVEEVEAVRAEPYRNDLARAVRPARPTSSGNSQTERPVERPSPLVLVSEQRIDRPAPVAVPGPVTPVRPRRVSAQAVAAQPAFDDDDLDDDDAADDDTDNIFGDSKGFAEFADRMGASDLPELLEAAAAYSAAVEGRAAFTRPQLLRQIASMTGNAVSREDELRGFGALLRNGRIVKVKRGQFALTEASSYLDEARKIAG